MESELWHPILLEGFEGKYEISSHRRIRRLPGKGCPKGRIIKAVGPKKNLTLSVDGKHFNTTLNNLHQLFVLQNHDWQKQETNNRKTRILEW